MLDNLLTMIPGPTPVHPRILDKLSQPTVSHLYPDFVLAYKESLDNFRSIMKSDKAQPFIIAGGGTLAMEMAVVNTLAPGERLLIVSHGYFGSRFEELADAFDIEVAILESEWGKAVEPDALQRHLKENHYGAVTITHVDTSTGTCSPVKDYCELFSGRDELIILDGVCASAGIDEQFDDWGVDVLLTAPQKAFGAPPGLALCLFSERAMAKRRSMERVPAYYADVLKWLPIMENPLGYYSTPAVNQIFAFLEATRIIIEEGLDQRFKRHKVLADAFRAGLSKLGFNMFTEDSCLADTLSLLNYPEGLDDITFRKTMALNGVVIAGCLGKLAGKACRVGHMGNITEEDIYKTLIAAEKSVKVVAGSDIAEGTAVAAAAEHMKW